MNCGYSEGSVVTPVITIVKGQWLHLWLQSLFGGSEHICACWRGMSYSVVNLVSGMGIHGAC